MQSSHKFFSATPRAMASICIDEYKSDSSSDSETKESAEKSKILLPPFIALYPHQTRDDQTATGIKQFNGFMPNNPNIHEFNRLIKSDVNTNDSLSKLFLSKTMNKCYLNMHQFAVKPYDWMDFAFLFNPKDIEDLHKFKATSLTSNMRTEAPVLLALTLKNDELWLEEYKGSNFKDLDYIIFEDPKISNRLRAFLFKIAQLSLQLRRDIDDHAATQSRFIKR